MPSFTHVSIPTRDMDRAVQWYLDLFGLEEIPTPNFGVNVRWFRVGNMQLHLYEADEQSVPLQHFGVAVDDFEAAYLKAQKMGAFDYVRGHHLYFTPANEVQLYLRDPDGNNIEVNWRDARSLPASIRDAAIKREDEFPQSERNRRASLFTTADASA